MGNLKRKNNGSEELSKAGDLAISVPALHHSTTCGETFHWLLANPGMPATAVIDDDGIVVGLVSRLTFLARYALQYSPELYSRKTILKLANLTPLIVDEQLSITDLGAALVLGNPSAIIDCFIVVSEGRYRGIGTTEALLRSKVFLLQARERELQDSEQDLRKALDMACEANAAKSNFLALMSHELRTPLNAIIGFSEVISTEMFGALGHNRYREYANDINGVGKHLLALISDILDLSKAEAGKFDLHCEDTMLDELIMECTKLMRDRAWSGGLQLTHSIDPKIPSLFVDRLRIKQILLNLLSNAIKFTPTGGRVGIEMSYTGGGRISVSVTDTGIGIAPEKIKMALEPFCQIDSPLSRNYEGTGLGLSLVKSLIEAHGGELELESALNIGTTARIIFPETCATSQTRILEGQRG